MINKEKNLKKGIRIHSLPKEFSFFPEGGNSPSQTFFLRDTRSELYDILDTTGGTPDFKCCSPRTWGNNHTPGNDGDDIKRATLMDDDTVHYQNITLSKLKAAKNLLEEGG